MSAAAVSTVRAPDGPRTSDDGQSSFISLARDIQAAARASDRFDLAERVDDAIRSAARTETIVCVV
ncbi:MAG TPA: hypothetical protein VK867_10690, partial [Candidatus Limnocylindrales bacterium]|nr:hypothetical protein [Candidatus Limnocylindrales bacterium]